MPYGLHRPERSLRITRTPRIAVSFARVAREAGLDLVADRLSIELKNLLAVAFSTTSLTSRHPVGTHAVRALSASGVVVGGSPAHRTS